MHPALSVIFFTVISGAGYGLLFLLGLTVALAPHALGRNEALGLVLIGVTFSSAGLISSLLHLGQPQRAWRALSQWRSSWLSREGVAASLGYAPALALAVGLRRGDGLLTVGAGIALAALAVLTVFCTARIYTSLKTIRAWHNGFVLPGYLLFALASGSAWLWASRAWYGWRLSNVPACAALLLLALCAVLKLMYWRFLDAGSHVATPESATGLGAFGRVREFEAPHTEENYLTREMGFVLARKHARRLRQAFALCALVVPAAALVCTSALRTGGAEPMLATLVALSLTFGLFIERWLFFAQAKHVVTLYYGAAQA